jgi:hypothetical protein
MPNPRGRPRRVSPSEPQLESQPPVGEPDTDEAPTAGPVEAPAPAARPVPESQLTPEQKRIRELENQLALERGKKDVEPDTYETANAEAGEPFVIHFLEDGITSLGKVWLRGQEIEFAPGGQAYRDTCDRHGRSWVDLRNNEFGQVERWGKVMFRNGPWPGKPWTAAAEANFERLASLKDGSTVAGPSFDELQAAERAEARRNRAAPVLPNR